jgi:exodeoxyribonuclease V beta subunit
MTVASIDLTRHAVIEASAGTGKTYTIEQLVLRLLLETGTPIERILLVTFTEKATGELRLRLRATLENRMRDSPDVFGKALDSFDQASIFTIHGFCQRLLQEYALEQRHDFRAVLVDDAELLPQVLREVQRKRWRSEFGRHLRAVLTDAGFGRGNADAWEQGVCELAKKYLPRCDHQLRPAPVADWWRRLDEIGADWSGQLEIATIAAVRQHLAEFKRQRGMHSFDDMIGTVEERLDPECNPDAPHLLRTLRERYAFGIVDEFQDTDPLQWRIFRRIFLEGGSSRLFVVGDPKQAIYSFRGADLPTYRRAAAELRELGDVHRLKHNWRSTPELLEALNCLFLDGEWFPRESGIDYYDVVPPRNEERKIRLVTDRTDRPAMSIVDLRDFERLKEARKHYSQFIAHEVRRLLGGQPALEFHANAPEPRLLEASDIGILVWRWAETEPIVAALNALDIPYSLQRPSGFWQSDEVLELETILQCLSRPEDRSALRKALLTSFFAIPPMDLVHNPDLPPTHPARQLYQRWLAHADARQWSALFQSMLEESGLIVRAMADPEAELRLATILHAMGTLERVGHGENRDLLGLLDWLHAKRRQRDQRDEGDAEPPLETHRSRVRIMTIHGSKGLEFPVVFVVGGFTKNPNPPRIATYHDEKGRKVFDLRPDGDARGQMAREEFDELRRLLYVALTRPMFKLYVPFVRAGAGSHYAGPVATILLSALTQACPEKLGASIADIVVPPRLTVPNEPAEADDATDSVPARPPFSVAGALFPPVDPHLQWRRILVRSFSSMSRQHVAPVGEGHSYGELTRVAPDESTPAEQEDPLRGPVFGDIVHRVLEKIDFTEAGRCTEPAELLREGTPARLRD